MSLLLPVQHIQQQSNWDCGVTCLRMLMNYSHVDLNFFEHLLKSYECNQSTWSIDLLHLIHQANISADLHTITIGCSSTYDNVPYYEGLINRDRERVEKLFVNKFSHVKLGSLEWTDLKKNLIDHQMPCLVLVDANKLACSTCRKSIFSRLVDKFIPTNDSSYQGHYILVVGFTTNDTDELIQYVDPGAKDELCTTTKENFDQARRAFGTDEDVILCYERKNI